MILDVRPPTGPTFSGHCDFDIIETVTGTPCLVRDRPSFGGEGTFYFVGGVTEIPRDGLAAQVFAAAEFDAIGKLDGADTTLPTRALIEPMGTDRLGARVWGKAVRISKAKTEDDEAPVIHEAKPDGDNLQRPAD